ncbi:hypothetical protein MMC25_007144 [Agyrium rufum]|nr:hypothetical protein [Agyrium rufum]
MIHEVYRDFSTYEQLEFPGYLLLPDEVTFETSYPTIPSSTLPQVKMMWQSSLSIPLLFLTLPSALSFPSQLFPRATTPTPFDSSSWPLPRNATTSKNTGFQIHDPSLIKSGSTYYSFSTGNLISIGSAPSLSGPWKHLGSVISGKSIINLPGNNDLWAPDVHLVNGLFYCYYAVSAFGSQTSAIGLATSSTLAPGSWTDLGAVFTSGSNIKSSPASITNAIDPNLFIDPATQKPYLTYGSFWADIWQFHLNADLKSVATSPAAVQVSEDPLGTRPEEGSFLSYNGGYYYLWFSHGICCGFSTTSLPAAGTEYSIRVGRSKSPSGPFLDYTGKDLKVGGGSIAFGSHSYVYAPGGQGVLTDNGQDILYYHYFNKNVGVTDSQAILGWNPISYVNGWPVLVS